MTQETQTLLLAAFAFLVCPAAYIALCVRMRWTGIPRPPYIPYFFVFGAVGGWMFTVMFPPSITLILCFVFLVTLAPLALIASSIYLATQPERSVYHRIALWSGFSYPVFLVFFMMAGMFLGA